MTRNTNNLQGICQSAELQGHDIRETGFQIFMVSCWCVPTTCCSPALASLMLTNLSTFTHLLRQRLCYICIHIDLRPRWRRLFQSDDIRKATFCAEVLYSASEHSDRNGIHRLRWCDWGRLRSKRAAQVQSMNTDEIQCALHNVNQFHRHAAYASMQSAGVQLESVPLTGHSLHRHARMVRRIPWLSWQKTVRNDAEISRSMVQMMDIQWSPNCRASLVCCVDTTVCWETMESQCAK